MIDFDSDMKKGDRVMQEFFVNNDDFGKNMPCNDESAESVLGEPI